MKLLLLAFLLTSCMASFQTTEYCEQINESMKICRDSVHNNHCRIFIEREKPYPRTETDKFWCKDTGYLGE